MPAKLPLDRLAGIAVREALEESPFTQADLAKQLGISRVTLTNRFRLGYAWSLGELVWVGGWLGIDLLADVAKRERSARMKKVAG